MRWKSWAGLFHTVAKASAGNARFASSLKDCGFHQKQGQLLRPLADMIGVADDDCKRALGGWATPAGLASRRLDWARLFAPVYSAVAVDSVHND